MKVKCKIMSRIVGYYREVEAWNPAKKEEFKNRNFSEIKR